MQIHSLLAGIANVHLIDDGQGIVLVDAGLQGMARPILRAVKRLGYTPRDVRLILLTHVHLDHAGSAAELRRLTGAPIAMHRGDAAYAQTGKHRIPTGRGTIGVSSKWVADRVDLECRYEPFEPDIWLEEGQRLAEFGLPGCVLHTPGHTGGSITLGLEDGALFVGDALINLFRVGYPMYWEDPDSARESGRKIQMSKPRILYSGHGRAFSGGELDRYLQEYARKKAQ